LYNFTSVTSLGYPALGLTLSGNVLYGNHHGSCSTGPSTNYCDQGTLFMVNTDGTGFRTLHTFTGGSEGGFPNQGLVFCGNTLYGTTSHGGTVFSLFITPQLTLMDIGPSVVLSWPTNFTGFTLQSTTNLSSPAIWTTNFSAPIVINGQN